jgi:sulfur carrier protein
VCRGTCAAERVPRERHTECACYLEKTSGKEKHVQIIVNGQPREVAEGMTVAQLLDELALATKYVAVEVNLQLVPRQKHPEHRLAEGDRLEIVTLVGGG